LLTLWPAVFVCLAVLGFNLLGDGLRERLDPTLAHYR
jgi:ABC-type dipeptide/oligopeptide/nickel transport system permease subunit